MKISQGEQKSYAAGKIMDALRASQVDPITGRWEKYGVALSNAQLKHDI